MRTFGPNVNGFHDVSDQMIDNLRRRAEAHFRRQEVEKAELTSIAAFEEHRKRVRDHFMTAIGGLPEERTPLNVQCTGSLDRGGFTIEKLIYESLPEFFVTAALYVPKGIVSPQPAVVFVHGHSDLGKSYPVYQAVCIDLAANGFVVLAVDPPGQGERFQYFDSEQGERIIGGCTTEHTYAGLQFTLGGASVGRHFIWDVMRGVDYLETRAEVDSTRIGLTGNSGGGTQSCLLMMSEPRFAASVPSTFVMTLESYMKTGQAQDSEQIVPGCFVNGPDHDDYITAMAPKPYLSVQQLTTTSRLKGQSKQWIEPSGFIRYTVPKTKLISRSLRRGMSIPHICVKRASTGTSGIFAVSRLTLQPVNQKP